jgi:hypothetical protein
MKMSSASWQLAPRRSAAATHFQGSYENNPAMAVIATFVGMTITGLNS